MFSLCYLFPGSSITYTYQFTAACRCLHRSLDFASVFGASPELLNASIDSPQFILMLLYSWTYFISQLSPLLISASRPPFSNPISILQIISRSSLGIISPLFSVDTISYNFLLPKLLRFIDRFSSDVIFHAELGSLNSAGTLFLIVVSQSLFHVYQ